MEVSKTYQITRRVLPSRFDDVVLQEIIAEHHQSRAAIWASLERYRYDVPLVDLMRPSSTPLARKGVLGKVLDSVAIDEVFDEVCLRNKFWDVNRIAEYFDEIVSALSPLASDLGAAYAVVASAVVLLACVYQYLTGCVDWGGSKAYSSGSLDFRDTYISIVLFQGAYVWIKSRDVASNKRIPKGAVYIITTSSKDGRTKVKYQPRFKPRKENGLSFNWIYLGQFDAFADAEAVYRIAASCYAYGKDYGPLDLGDGREFFPIPEMTADEQSLSGEDKLDWVKERVEMVYQCYKTEKDARNLPPPLTGADSEQENQLLRSQNSQLREEVLHERQQKEELASQLHQLLHPRQQVQEPTVQDLELQSQHLQQEQQFHVHDLDLQYQDHQQQLQLGQAQDLELLPQDIQQQQHEEEPLTYEWYLKLLNAEPILEEGSGASTNSGDIQWTDETPMRSPATFGDSVHTQFGR